MFITKSLVKVMISTGIPFPSPWNPAPIIIMIAINRKPRGAMLKNSEPVEITVGSSLNTFMNMSGKVIRIDVNRIMASATNFIADFIVFLERSYLLFPAF